MNRRDILKATGGLAAISGLAACGSLTGGSPGAVADPLSGASLMRDVETYVGFGNHRSGGKGDTATSNWFARRWKALGYEIEDMPFSLPNADTTTASLEIGGETFSGFGQPPLAFTPAGGLAAPLVVWSSTSPGDVAGAIAVISIPRKFGAASPSAAYRDAFGKARAAGAIGAVGVITSPSRDLVAINTPVDLAAGIPVLLIGERDQPRLSAAMARRAPGRLRIEGRGGSRTARNTVARFGKAGPWLVVSTPQSGWFNCGGERGPGVAMLLALSDWARRQALPCRLCFVATSGHEWMYYGADMFREAGAPKPEETALWVHLGASYAARGYTETPGGLMPLDTPNPGSIFMVSADLADRARTAFAGQPPLDKPVIGSVAASAGELTALIREGYKSYFGFFGYSGLFHTPADTAASTSPAIMEPIARSIARLIRERLTGAA